MSRTKLELTMTEFTDNALKPHQRHNKRTKAQKTTRKVTTCTNAVTNICLCPYLVSALCPLDLATLPHTSPTHGRIHQQCCVAITDRESASMCPCEGDEERS